MAQSTDAIMIAGNGSVFVAPVGSTLPVTPVSALDAAFIDLGYVTEDGATFRRNRTTEPISAWQSFNALKHIVTEVEDEVEFVLSQWDINTVPLAFGGGAIVATALAVGPPIVPAYYTYAPPDPEDLDERALVLEWAYDTYNYRVIVPRIMVTSGVESQLARSQASDLPITAAVLATDGAAPWTLVTDHPDFAAA